MPFKQSLIPFKDRKLCTMVVGHWTKERRKILKFFDKQLPDKLEFYGKLPPKLRHPDMYKGKIQGSHFGEEKISTLARYRFCICFENTTGYQGYITEKIFCCFSAGCVPIYWGASNIENYIPKACFIDYRDFKNDKELYDFIANMTEKRYQEYIEAIKKYLESDRAKLFSPEFFEDLFYKALTSK